MSGFVTVVGCWPAPGREGWSPHRVDCAVPHWSARARGRARILGAMSAGLSMPWLSAPGDPPHLDQVAGGTQLGGELLGEGDPDRRVRAGVGEQHAQRGALAGIPDPGQRVACPPGVRVRPGTSPEERGGQVEELAHVARAGKADQTVDMRRRVRAAGGPVRGAESGQRRQARRGSGAEPHLLGRGPPPDCQARYPQVDDVETRTRRQAAPTPAPPAESQRRAIATPARRVRTRPAAHPRVSTGPAQP